MKIYIDIDVPDDWNDRLDMQWIVEGEVKADRWSWHRAIPSPVNAQLLEALHSIVDCCDEEHAARDYCSRQTEIRGIARAALEKL